MTKKSKSLTKNKPNYLVCVGTEKYSESALDFTCDMAKKNKGNVVLIHVIEPTDFQSIGVIADKIRNKQHDESQELLKTLAAKAKKKHSVTPSIMVREGLIEDEIIAVASEDESITMLIAEASPGHSKTSKTIPSLIASVGNKLSIPVLIVPSVGRQQKLENVG